MPGLNLTRLRWRWRGASMWPSVAALSLLDGLILHLLPVFADRQALSSGVLQAFIANLLMVVALTPPLGRAVRRLRADMPVVVARDYAGRFVCVAVTLAVLAGGVVHHSTVLADRAALRAARADAQAYIGAHAPPAFLVSLHELSVYALQPPTIYRLCATAAGGGRSYCVVVNLSRPRSSRTAYSGAEPNSLISEGTS